MNPEQVQAGTDEEQPYAVRINPQDSRWLRTPSFTAFDNDKDFFDALMGKPVDLSKPGIEHVELGKLDEREIICDSCNDSIVHDSCPFCQSTKFETALGIYHCQACGKDFNKPELFAIGRLVYFGLQALDEDVPYGAWCDRCVAEYLKTARLLETRLSLDSSYL